MSTLRNQPSSEDQRNILIATLLFGLIMFGWLVWFGPEPSEPTPEADSAATEQSTDSTTAAEAEPLPAADSTGDSEASASDPEPVESPSDPATARAESGTARTVTVVADQYTAEFSTRGGVIERFTLTDYKQFDRETPVQVVDTSGRGVPGMSFMTPSSHLVDTRALYFETDAPDTLRVDGSEEVALTFTATLGEDAQGELSYTYTFTPEPYDLNLQIAQQNPRSYAARDGYDLVWDQGVPFTEDDPEGERVDSGVYAFSGGTLERLVYDSAEYAENRLSGSINWIGHRSKYFTAVLMPDSPEAVDGAEIIREEGVSETIRGGEGTTARLFMPPATSDVDTQSFSLYMGPIDYYNLVSYERELYSMVNYGWAIFEWITRPLATFIFIPALTYLGGVLPNYGLVVILLAIFIKMVVYPLTKSSYRSMAKMKDLKPEMDKIKEKYEDDMEKQQEEMMKLYRESGVNPIGGCLPMFLQYPIIIALYLYIPQSVQLRQESFLWAADLSAPDPILQLPFSIPFYGDYVAGFTLLMGIAMIFTMRIQMSSTGSTGAQAKIFQWVLPFFIFFIFNRFASALSLYYLFYNVVTAAQQKYIYWQLDKEKEQQPNTRFEANKNGDDSDGWFARLLKKAEEAQKEARQRK
ncbi:membrane protein insertase YidC [Longimonas halophila]|nr:membrane protein insertase YidC [Longimonas halophila]